MKYKTDKKNNTIAFTFNNDEQLALDKVHEVIGKILLVSQDVISKTLGTENPEDYTVYTIDGCEYDIYEMQNLRAMLIGLYYQGCSADYTNINDDEDEEGEV